MIFHAHIYYTEATRNVAQEVHRNFRNIPLPLRTLEESWQSEDPFHVSGLHDYLIGPHPQPMFQITFTEREFPQVVQWLMFNRQGLTVLVHPRTGDEIADHATYPIWMGNILQLDMTRL